MIELENHQLTPTVCENITNHQKNMSVKFPISKQLNKNKIIVSSSWYTEVVDSTRSNNEQQCNNKHLVFPENCTLQEHTDRCVVFQQRNYIFTV